MTEHYDVIVIGSGIGGMVAALRCARAGRSVLVLEAGKQFGGYTNPFARKHFHFDPGIHYIGECGPGGSFRRLLDRLGLEHVAFKELDPDGFDHYVFPDYAVKNCVGLDRFRDRLAADFPAERRNLDRFFKLLADVDFVVRKTQRMPNAGDAIRLLRRTPNVLRWYRSTAKSLLDHYFDDRRLKGALAGPVGDLGLPPSRLAAIMLMGLLTHYANGAYFPAGGSGPLRDGFVEGLRTAGADLKRNARVASIEHSGGKVTGVTTAKGERYTASTVISNAQATATYDMVGLEHLGNRLRRKVDNIEHSYGSVVIFMGVDGDLDTSALGSSNVWSYGGDVEDMYAQAALDDFRKNTSFFLTVPTNKDPDGALAPAGQQTVELVTLCQSDPYKGWFGAKSMRRGDDYESLKNQVADHFVALAERHLPGLSDHVVLREVATPATNFSYTLSPSGNIYGPAHTPEQIAPWRFNTQSPLAGLFLCGASVMSAGIVPCASSGALAAKQALASMDRPSSWALSAPAQWWRNATA